MYLREKVYLGLGLLLGTIGIVSSVFWSIKVGIVFLTFLVMLIFVLIVLQRRQLAKVQHRTLRLLQNQGKKPVREEGRAEISVHIATKKIIGLLQAQQISMDLLKDRLDHSNCSEAPARDDC